MALVPIRQSLWPLEADRLDAIPVHKPEPSLRAEDLSSVPNRASLRLTMTLRHKHVPCLLVPIVYLYPRNILLLYVIMFHFLKSSSSSEGPFMSSERRQRASLPSMTKPKRQPSLSTMGKIHFRQAGTMIPSEEGRKAFIAGVTFMYISTTYCIKIHSYIIYILCICICIHI